jgi:hypothetical protein
MIEDMSNSNESGLMSHSSGTSSDDEAELQKIFSGLRVVHVGTEAKMEKM